MRIQKLLALGLASVLTASVITVAADAPKTDSKESTKGVRLVKPFSEMKDLTPEEITKLKEIHKKFLDDLHALESKAMDDEMAVLTDDQKKEATALESAKKEHKAATKPAAPAK